LLLVSSTSIVHTHLNWCCLLTMWSCNAKHDKHGVMGASLPGIEHKSLVGGFELNSKELDNLDSQFLNLAWLPP